MTDFRSDFEIIYDHEYTQHLNDRIRAKFRTSGMRNATHASDLFYCLRKAWWKRLHLDEEDETHVDLLLTWMLGLLFEDLVTEGEPQKASAYCWQCGVVNRILGTPPGKREVETCPECGERWLIFTPDYIVDGVVHEVKQTRKSRRRGPQDAPWWIDQLRTYFAFARVAGWSPSPYARLVACWLMGDYGSRRKGEKPRPPNAALDAFKVVFKPETLEPWMVELRRRARITEGTDVPPLTGMGGGDEQSPAYEWECPSCPMGKAGECEMYKWDEDGKEKDDSEKTDTPASGEPEESA